MHTIGVMLNSLGPDRLQAFRLAAEMGFGIVHTGALPESWLAGTGRDAYGAAARQSRLSVAAMFVGFDGQSYADLETIRRTVGLVNQETRAHRVSVALRYISLARELGAPKLAAHLGFIPHDPVHPDFLGLVAAVRTIVDACAKHGLGFDLETGQDSADVLIRLIRAVDRPNLGVNFDPANFILYGTDEPLEALDKLAPWIRGVHCKDALPSPLANELGTDVPIGSGRVDFEALPRKLRVIGYTGPLIIERERGPDVVNDIRRARDYLREILNRIV